MEGLKHQINDMYDKVRKYVKPGDTDCGSTSDATFI